MALHRKICTWIFIVTLLIIAQTWKPKPSVGEWTYKLRSFYISLGVGNTDFLPMEEEHAPEGQRPRLCWVSSSSPSRSTGWTLEGGQRVRLGFLPPVLSPGVGGCPRVTAFRDEDPTSCLVVPFTKLSLGSSDHVLLLSPQDCWCQGVYPIVSSPGVLSCVLGFSYALPTFL